MQYADWGADALAVLTDLEHTSGGYTDLVYACRATRIPVLQQDWMLHPMQVAYLHFQQRKDLSSGVISKP